MRRKPSGAVLAVVISAALCGCHLIFPFDAPSGGDSAVSLDGRPDSDGDAGAGDGPHLADGVPDLPESFLCGAGKPCCSPDRWCWENPLPQGNNILGLWGSAPDDVWAVGGMGTLLHFDGVRWLGVDPGTTVTLFGIWGSGPSDIYAVGEQGTILRYDGKAWTKVASGTNKHLNAIWGSGPQEIFAVGDGGTVVRYNGTQWSTMPTSFPSLRLTSIWGADPTDLYATGFESSATTTSGTILHYDGYSWKPSHGPLGGARLYSIWGSGPSDVFAVGDYQLGGRLDVVALHFNGSTWKSVPPSTTPGSLRAIWGTSKSHAVAVGMTTSNHWALIYRYDGTTWHRAPTDPVVETTPHLLAVWGTSPANCFAAGVGGQVVRYNGSSWSKQIQDLADGVNLRGVWGSGPSDVFVAGGAPGLSSILHFDGQSWSSMSHPSVTTYFNDTWGSSHTDVWVVGVGHTVLRYDGNQWNTIPHGTNDGKYWLEGVWGAGPTDLFVAGGTQTGDNISGVIRRYNGATWSTPYEIQGQYLFDIWGSAPGDLFAVGYEGTVHTNKDPLILHSTDGTLWNKMPLPGVPTDRRLSAVWGSGPSDVYAVGGWWYSDRLVLHYGGNQWTEITGIPGKEKYFSDVWGSGPSDLYISGFSGTIAHFDGKSWQEMTPNLVHSYGPAALWGSGPGNLYAVGKYGMILHHQP